MIPSAVLWKWLHELSDTRERILVLYQGQIKMMLEYKQAAEAEYADEDAADFEALAKAHPVLTRCVRDELAIKRANTNHLAECRAEIERLQGQMREIGAAMEEINKRLLTAH